MSFFFQFLARAALVFLSLGVPARAVTLIETDADVLFAWPGDATRTAMRSNAVVATMLDSLDFALMDEWSVRLPVGTSAELSHRIVNRGPVPLRFRLTARNQSADGFDLGELALFADTNANARPDSGEREIAPDTVITLQPGEQLDLVACGTVPMAATAEKVAIVVIMAEHLDGNGLLVRVNTVAAMEHAGTGLLVEKTASRREAEIGETVDYTVRVRNAVGATLPAVILNDRLPAGFTYVPGSLRRNNETAFDPLAAVTGGFVLPLGSLAANATMTLRYRARLGPGALGGDGVNHAQAVAPGYESNTASVRVKVREGVFTDKGIMIGRVFLDTNRDGRPQPDEPGVPGVRLYLEDGTYAVTDPDGKYSFYGLSPRTHILKPDPLTLPRDTELLATTTRQAGDAASRFVDLKRYELHQANLALVATSAAAVAEIDARRARARRSSGEMKRELDTRLTPDGQPAPIADPKARPATGVVAEERWSDLTPRRFERVEVNALHPAVPDPTDAELASLDAEPGFVGLHDGDILPTPQTDLRVKGRAGAKFSVAVNGRLIGPDQVGSITHVGTGVEVWTFIGVDLAGGQNRLRLLVADSFGNPREGAALRVTAPGGLAQIKLTAPAEAPADAATVTNITVELQDARGTPVTTRTALTLESTQGRWLADDLDPAQPGLQTFVEGGRAIFGLVAPSDPGECDFTAASGVVRGEATLSFTPDLRPLIAAGVVEGVIHLGSGGGGGLEPASTRDGFEEELRTWSAAGDAGRLGAGGRAAFFLKGKVRGDTLLTAAYDSEKDGGKKLFRDIQPGEYYPVYGDASVRGYEAQSTGRLYVRLDRNRSYLLLGDFTTQTADPDAARGLATYQRSLNGVKEHFENDRLSANAWASQDSSRQVVEEMSANGTSGPYPFAPRSVRVNSERVEILTRDRDQPARIISVRTMSRFFDYEFEPFTGRLLLRAPLRSLDADLNPVSLRITYEVDEGGPSFWTYGADAQYRLTDRLTLSGTYARDENPTAAYELAGGGALWRFGPKTTLAAEAARSDSVEPGPGLAGRVELRHHDEKTDARIFYGETDPAFRNPASLLLPGRVEAGFKVTHKLRPTTSLMAQGLLTEDTARHARREGVRMDVAQSVGAWRFELGARHSEQTAASPNGAARAAGPSTVNSLRARITAPLPLLSGATAYTEYERDVSTSRRELAAVGFDATLQRGGRLYGRHEFITSLGGAFELNEVERNHNTVVGLETGYMKGGQVFSEYRAGQEIYGPEAEAALGLRNLFTLAEGVRLNTSVERVTPVSGSGRNESTALAGAIEFERVRWRSNARLELRASTSTDSLLNTLGYARRLGDEWTFLGKSILLLTRTKGAAGGDALQSRVQTGFAWRPARDDRWNLLGKYEVRYETDDRAAATVSRRLTHILAADAAFTARGGWTLSGHYAGKLTAENGVTAETAHLVGGRWRREFGRRWDAGLNAWALLAGDGGQLRGAVGPEAGVTLRDNLRLGLGYNFTGFRDRDLASDGTTAQGVFLRLAFKFDEKLLRGWKEKKSP
ncbi:MAG: DUF11 domain-containing protein [Opitutae bacterium]|nr:DUF11 domain-containing protein [Opitutae bacterium]